MQSRKQALRSRVVFVLQTHDTFVKTVSQHSTKSPGFFARYSGFLPQGMLTEWVGIGS